MWSLHYLSSILLFISTIPFLYEAINPFDENVDYIHLGNN